MSSTKPRPASDTPADGTPELPGFGQRFGALLIDWMLCLLLANGLLAIDVLPAWEYPVWPSVVLVAYYGVFIGLFTQTVGMRLLKIRCVTATDGTALGVPRALLRGLATALVVPILTAFSDPHRRGLHDKASGSAVVR